MRKNFSLSKKRSEIQLDRFVKNKMLDDFIHRSKFGKLVNAQEKLFFKKSGHINIAYTKFSRSFYLNNKPLFDRISVLCNSKILKSEMFLANNTYVLIKRKKPNYLQVTHKGLSHSNAFIVKISTPTSSKKYFVKEINAKFGDAFIQGRNGFREVIAQSIIKDLGFNTVPIHFCICDYKHNQSFIVYEFTKLHNLEDLLIRNNSKIVFKNKIFTIKDFDNLCFNIQNEINIRANSLKDKYNLKTNDQIIDISPENMFLDLKKGKLYIFDPWLNGDKSNFITRKRN